MELFVLFGLLIIFVITGAVEYSRHQAVVSGIPIRIHVNGSRGKSSVTRLIAAGLRAGSIKTFAKTTGSAPRIIDEKGKDHIIHRLRSASIGEQKKLLRMFAKETPKAVVIECMAVQPEYQWVTEQKMMKSTIGVLTNVRPDHLDEMGHDLTSIAYSMSNTIPKDAVFVTGEEKNIAPLEEVAENRNSKFIQTNHSSVTKEYMNKFPFLEHSENVALALKVCELAGVNQQTALDGMVHTTPDPGALQILELTIGGNHIHFINAFAANDPHSTMVVWEMLAERVSNREACIFLNTREDRRYRTKQLLELCYKHLKPAHLIIRGDNIDSLISEKIHKNIDTRVFPLSSTQNEIINSFKKLDNHFVMGIGNIVGWGDQFMKELKNYG